MSYGDVLQCHGCSSHFKVSTFLSSPMFILSSRVHCSYSVGCTSAGSAEEWAAAPPQVRAGLLG